jgi:acyl-CoA hydrolase
VTLEAKAPRASLTTMTEYVLPTHANLYGNVFGGQIMAWMDLCAAICAQRHTGTLCITAGVDDLSFDQSIRVGQVVRLSSRVTAAFRTSLEVECTITGEDTIAGTTWPCVSAFLTFVSVGQDLKPVPCPPVLPETVEERALAEGAAERRAHRLSKRRRPT